MNKRVAGVLGAALLAIGLTGIALGDNDEDEREGRSSRGADVPAATNTAYLTECGGCHFAYQPGLLPADDWRRLMGSLDSHFGDDASLDPAVTKDLLDYLFANAADGNASIRSRAFAAMPRSGDAPPRITETVYFQRKHSEIPARLVRDNPQVKSFSNCQNCHREAERGSFNEDQVSIPGAAGWKD